MPEGPEAHNIALQLKARITGYDIYAIEWGHNPRHENMDKLPLPCRIIDVYARGKRPVIVTDRGFIVTFLAMAGKWLFSDRGHTRIKLKLGHIDKMFDDFVIVDDCFDLFYEDSRFGKVHFCADEDQLKKHFANFGPDLITDEYSFSEFKKSASTPGAKRMQVCKFLMEPKYNSSIGSYLKSEIMFKAQIHPARIVSTLTNTELKRLYYYAIKITRASYEAGGFTLNSYLTPDEKPGGYVSICYGKKFDAQGNKIIKSYFGDRRSSYWSPELVGDQVPDAPIHFQLKDLSTKDSEDTD